MNWNDALDVHTFLFSFFFFLQKDFFVLLTRNVVKRNDEDEIKIFKTQCHNVGTGMRFLKRRHQKMRDKVQETEYRETVIISFI